MIGNSRTRQFLAEQLRSMGARTVKKRSGQSPTHSSLDKEWIVEPRTLPALEAAHLLDLQAGLPSAYMAEYHGPSFPLHLTLILEHVDCSSLLQLHAELRKCAAIPSPMIALRSSGKEAQQVRLHFPSWIVDEVRALRLHAYAVHWLAQQAPELGVNLSTDGDMYRHPLPLLGYPQMLGCPSCRGATGRMELCSQCGMTGWVEQLGGRMELLGSWTDDGEPSVLQPADLLQQLRIRSDECPNMTVPECTPALPLWQCKCQTWRNQKDARCSSCSARPPVGRIKWGGVYPQPPSAVQLTPQSEDGWCLPVLQTSFRSLLRRVGGSPSHPWQHCTMGPVWKLGAAKFQIVLQGLGSACHPGGAHPNAPMVLTITPQGVELTCSAPGCKFSTGKRSSYIPQLFPVANTHNQCYQFAYADTRLQWAHRVLDDYRNSQRI